MPERYTDTILKYLAERSYQPLKPRQLARRIGVDEEDYGTFRDAVRQLEEQGRVVLGNKNAVTLPRMGDTVIGTYRPNPRGFGFVIPEDPNAHGDLFIPPNANGTAMTGDEVRAKVIKRGRRDGEDAYEGRIVEVIHRATNRFVGILETAGDMHFVNPEGKRFTQPIVIRDVGGQAGPILGTKVAVEIVDYNAKGDLPVGVIVEELGEPGELDVETDAVIMAYGLPDAFSDEALDEARQAVRSFNRLDLDDPSRLDHRREDISDQTIITIDPPDARDYDDAISIDYDGKSGVWTLGVHIADVSHFVPDGSVLDEEARQRGTSVYFPRRVVPMLPEILSNGVCSLQEYQKRFVKSVYIRYGDDGEVIDSRFAESIIQSARRLTYRQAQDIIDGRTAGGGGSYGGGRHSAGYGKKVVKAIRWMHELARRIEKRREANGMLHLDLPAVELILDDAGKVVDAEPEDQSYTHTIIEMFMVEANEAVARRMAKEDRNILRRVHPDPDKTENKDLQAFISACGHKLPKQMDRHAIQALLDSVKGRPESYAVNLAILKTFQQAEYSPMKIGHFALASSDYCHFTSPIRRYADLTVHRTVARFCRGELEHEPPEDISELTRLGEALSACDRRADDAADELREVLVLQLLESKQGEVFDGVITGVAKFGMFVQWPKYLIDGLVRFDDLGNETFDVDAKQGVVRGKDTGQTVRLGDRLNVQVASVDVARRQLDLVPTKKTTGKNGTSSGGKSKKSKKSNKGRKGKSGNKSGGQRKGGKGGKSGKSNKSRKGRKKT
ncbi:MAG: ribonuclease R [Planctomycetes bacterium]|jgi:ribonuclease R|nr:ribonuclease R [Phycisphaerae bacterium]NBB96494.1 ribonuclease R [Planctomycetota bacterium]